jgi:hypothetical protein
LIVDSESATVLHHSEGTYELVHAITFGLIALGVALMAVGIVMLVSGTRDTW